MLNIHAECNGYAVEFTVFSHFKRARKQVERRACKSPRKFDFKGATLVFEWIWKLKFIKLFSTIFLHYRFICSFIEAIIYLLSHHIILLCILNPFTTHCFVLKKNLTTKGNKNKYEFLNMWSDTIIKWINEVKKNWFDYLRT